MQIEAQDYLRLVEKAGTIVFLDTESTGLNGDYNSLLCVSFKPYGKKPYSFRVRRPGDDRKLIEDAIKEMERYDCIVTFNGVRHDFPLMEARSLFHRGQPLPRLKHHLDLYLKLKYRLKAARKNQAHLSRWLDTGEKKMDMSPQEWNDVLAYPEKNFPTMIQRCESDVRGLEAMYKRCRHLIKDIKRT